MAKDLSAMTDRLNHASTPAEQDADTAPARTRDTQTTAADTSGRISLYLPDRTLKKRLRVAALEADTTVSAQFTEWAEDWLNSHGH